MRLDTNFVEVVFLAKLPALSASKFKVLICSDEPNLQNKMRGNNKQQDENHINSKREKTQIYCMKCPVKNKDSSGAGFGTTQAFDVDKLPDSVIQLENSRFLLTFHEDTKLLSTVKDKEKVKVRGAMSGGMNTAEEEYIEIQFAAYPTQQFRNGAYLFSTDSRRQEDVEVIKQR